jgi:hypothetical protein
VHVVVAPDVTLVGLQTSDDMPRAGVTVTVAMVLPPSVAVTVTVSEAATEPAVAVKVAVVALAGTVSEAGTGNAAGLFDARATVLLAASAARSKVTVHVVAAPAVRLAGAHASEDTLGLGAIVTVTVALLAPSVAVKVTGCSVATEPDVAVNVVDAAPAGTVTDAGAGSAVASFETSVTVLPPVGAA